MKMKKNVRILAIAMVLGNLLISCSTKEIDILEPSLPGTYTYKAVIVNTPVDTNKDGVLNTDLMKEGDECVWDNIWKYYEGNHVVLSEGNTVCDINFPNAGEFTYTYEPKKKIIIIKYKGGSEDILNDVKLGFSNDYKQTLSFTIFDNRLQQDVTYYLESTDQKYVVVQDSNNILDKKLDSYYTRDGDGEKSIYDEVMSYN